MNNALSDVFEHTIQDICNSERQIIAALPEMLNAASDPDLKEAISDHLAETREQLTRIEEVCRIMGFPTGNVTCQATAGLIREAKEQMEKFGTGPAGDAAIIACAQKVEHYEISNYGTVIEWADQLNASDAKHLLAKTLKEEQGADNRLNKIAKHSVNDAAMNAAVVRRTGAVLY